MANHKRYPYAETEASGPDYPSLGAAVAKWRTLARDGLRTLTRDERRAYGEAVERAHKRACKRLGQGVAGSNPTHRGRPK
jgi:hypothetical protein